VCVLLNFILFLLESDVSLISGRVRVRNNSNNNAEKGESGKQELIAYTAGVFCFIIF
jgi:hypothetical protein